MVMEASTTLPVPMSSAKDAQLTTHRERVDLAFRTSSVFRTDAKEDYGFVEGHRQWDPKDVEELALQRRPALVFNNILSIVNLISGQERTSRLGITFKPRGINDDLFSQIINSCFRFASDATGLEYEISHAFTDMNICGRGFLYNEIDFNNIEDPLGNIKTRRIHPLTTIWDPNYVDYDMQDCSFIGRLLWAREDTLRYRFPEAMEDIKPGEWLERDIETLGEATIESDWRLKREKMVRLVELWYKIPKKVWLLVTPDGGVQRFDSKEKVKGAVELVSNLAISRNMPVPTFEILERTIYDVRVAHICYWKVLSDRPSPYKSGFYPFVPFLAYNFDEVTMGVVRSLKDPQREKNKRWSQVLHMVNTMAKGGWKIPKGSVDKETLSKWKVEAAKSGFYFEYSRQVGEPKEIASQTIPSSIIDLMGISENEIRRISGAIQELLGMAQGADQSGKAIKTLQQSGATILAPLFDNLVRSQKILGNQYVHLIGQYYTPEKVEEILGQQQVNPLTQTTNPNVIAEQAIRAQYNVVVDTSPLVASERDRQYSQVISIMEIMAKAGIPPTPPMLLILLEISDFPNKDQYISQLKAAIQQQPTSSATVGPQPVGA